MSFIAIVLAFALFGNGTASASRIAHRDSSARHTIRTEAYRHPDFAHIPSLQQQRLALQRRPLPPLKASSHGFTEFVNTVSRLFLSAPEKKHRLSFLALPEITYGDRDGLGLGATARIYINDFRPLPQGQARRQSYVDISGDFTFKGDMSIAICPSRYVPPCTCWRIVC